MVDAIRPFVVATHASRPQDGRPVSAKCMRHGGTDVGTGFPPYDACHTVRCHGLRVSAQAASSAPPSNTVLVDLDRISNDV